MNLNKLKIASNNKVESFERFIQNARVNEELEKMNKIISFDDAKEYLINLFKNNKDYEIFNTETELKRKRHIIIPTDLKWKKEAFSIWNPNKKCGFIIYTNDEINKYANFFIKSFSNSKDDFYEYINTQNEFDDIKDKIDFYINSYEYLEEEKPVKFKDLTIDYNWFIYSDLKNLTDNCIKYNKKCNIKDCKNNNKCKNYFPIVKYTENMFKYNKNINTFIELICKTAQVPVSISQEKVSDEFVIRYNIGKLGIDITTSSREDKLYSSASILVYTHIKDQMIPLYTSKDKVYFKKGKEQFKLFFDLINEYRVKEKEWIKHAKRK